MADYHIALDDIKLEYGDIMFILEEFHDVYVIYHLAI